MVVLGVDPGTAITGYGVVAEEEGNLRMVAAGVVTTPAGQLLECRLQAIYRGLRAVAAEYHPVSAAVEKLFFSRNVRTAMSVGHARGVSLLALADAGVPLSEYSPSEIKQAVAGYGGADKQQVQQMVKTLLGLTEVPQPDDCADALAVAICHLHWARWHTIVDQA